MNWNKTAVAVFLLLLGGLLIGCGQERYDVLITGGTIIDGSGQAGFEGDVAIRDGRIAAVGEIPSARADKMVDARGKYVVPGFIDLHTHGDRGILDEEGRKAQNYITQGVTTIVTGNCGGGTFDVAQFYATMEEQGIGTNIVHLVGHGTVRSAVMQDAARAPTDEEMEKMKALVDQAMQGGAAGMSTGLFYTPGSFAETDEVVELCKVVGQHGGIYASHIRDESNYTTGLQASITEAIEIGEKAGVPVQISHIKGLGKPVWGQAGAVAEIIEAAQARGVKVLADQYPYNASSTSLGAATLPLWVQADGKVRERLADPSLTQRIKKEIAANIERRGGAETLVISSFRQKPEYEGKSLLEISQILDKSTVDTAIELVLAGGPGVVSFNMSDADVEFFMKKPYVMTGSDGGIVQFGRGVPHPRNYGAFTKKIRTYVLDKKVLTMEQAIHAATGLAAEMLEFSDRGLLKEGYVADIVVFDPENIRDKATFSEPHQYSEGIDFVLVNGAFAVDGGQFTGTLAGKPLRRNSGL
jgi:N-acyl-D-aspartate/D-glutamate deacylase